MFLWLIEFLGLAVFLIKICGFRFNYFILVLLFFIHSVEITILLLIGVICLNHDTLMLPQIENKLHSSADMFHFKA